MMRSKRHFELLFVLVAIALVATFGPKLLNRQPVKEIEGAGTATNLPQPMIEGISLEPTLKLGVDEPETILPDTEVSETGKVWTSLINSGRQALNQGDNLSALSYFLKAYEVAKPLGASYQHTAILAAAGARLQLGQYEEALKAMQLAIESADKFPSPRRENHLFTDQLVIATILHSSGHSEEALAKLGQAQLILTSANPKKGGFYTSGMNQLVKLHRKYGDNEGADRLMAEL